ncbi:hypothetical protein C2869_01115 [Saccharobesus litoralis]|uniref:Uncharacterized protein n=1 Tax=Saccharobesus litoralis TaxID=2172099 RepID=A0A2S0VLQ8_9ALTE|nr:hypothetical protein [Saccharobesus litoralis]AWB65125.1 hypothetical protein C2869_01115 [Saccharobesus litoralis]
MKILTFLLFFLTSFITYANELCPTNKNIAEDMRIPESHYSKENADLALKKLQGIVQGSDKKYEWITVPNALKTIEGYILKRDAISAKGAMQEYHLSAFCTFMESSAWYD